jgi:nucleoside transporter
MTLIGDASGYCFMKSKIPAYVLSAVVMFLTLFAWGSYFVPMGRYLSVHFPGDASVTGFAYGAGPLAAMVSPLIAGWLADRAMKPRYLFCTLGLVGGALLWCVPMATTTFGFSTLLFLHALCYFAALPLLNAMVLKALAEHSQFFPWFRVSGTLGWIASGFVVAFVGNHLLSGLEVATSAKIFQIGALAMVVAGLLALGFKSEAEAAQENGAESKGSVWELLADKQFQVFLLFSFLFCIPLSLYFSYANQFLATRGVAHPEAVMTLGQVSEVVFLLLLPFALYFLSAKHALLVGMACWAIRYAIFAVAGTQESWLIAGILLHGVCYDFFFVTGMQYADRRAPAGLRNLAQSAVAWVTLGLGLWAGNMIAPLLDSRFIDRTNPAAPVFRPEFWAYPSAFAGLLLIIFAVFYRDNTRLSSR